MEFKLIKFSEWRQNLDESGAMRRLKRDAFQRGTMPAPAPASVNSGNTGTPFEIEQAKKVKTHADKEKADKKPKRRSKKSDK